MKKILSNLLIASIAFINITSVAAAQDAPPSVNLGGLFEDEEQAPPQADFGNFGEDQPNAPAQQQAQQPNAGAGGGGGAVGAGGGGGGARSGASGQQMINGNIFSDIRLLPPQVNPSLQNSQIVFSVQREAQISVAVLNSAGNLVSMLTEKQVAAPAVYSDTWNPKGMPAGNYTYRLTAYDLRDGKMIDHKTRVLNVTYNQPTLADTPAQQRAARTAINQATSGTLSQTGPGLLLYLLFPAFAFVKIRKK